MPGRGPRLRNLGAQPLDLRPYAGGEPDEEGCAGAAAERVEAAVTAPPPQLRGVAGAGADLGRRMVPRILLMVRTACMLQGRVMRLCREWEIYADDCTIRTGRIVDGT